MQESERIAKVEANMVTLDRDLRAHLTSCETSHREIQARFSVVDRMLWTALGGLIVIAGLVGLYGHNIMKALSA